MRDLHKRKNNLRGPTKRDGHRANLRNDRFFEALDKLFRSRPGRVVVYVDGIRIDKSTIESFKYFDELRRR